MNPMLWPTLTFATVLFSRGRTPNHGGPTQRREVKSLADLRAEYHFTGFFLILK